MEKRAAVRGLGFALLSAFLYLFSSQQAMSQIQDNGTNGQTKKTAQNQGLKEKISAQSAPKQTEDEQIKDDAITRSYNPFNLNDSLPQRLEFNLGNNFDVTEMVLNKLRERRFRESSERIWERETDRANWAFQDSFGEAALKLAEGYFLPKLSTGVQTFVQSFTEVPERSEVRSPLERGRAGLYEGEREKGFGLYFSPFSPNPKASAVWVPNEIFLLNLQASLDGGVELIAKAELPVGFSLYTGFNYWRSINRGRFDFDQKQGLTPYVGISRHVAKRKNGFVERTSDFNLGFSFSSGSERQEQEFLVTFSYHYRF